MPGAGVNDQDRAVKRSYTILIADRNPHVRALLKREMRKEGYRITLAGTTEEVLRRIYASEPLDLIIIDPELPGVGAQEVLKELENRLPPLPIIAHSLSIDSNISQETSDHIVFLEKGAESIERLKQVTAKLLKRLRARNSKIPD